jgi:hypothetical protein
MDENIEIKDLELANNTIIALKWEIGKLHGQLDASHYEIRMLRECIAILIEPKDESKDLGKDLGDDWDERYDF